MNIPGNCKTTFIAVLLMAITSAGCLMYSSPKTYAKKNDGIKQQKVQKAPKKQRKKQNRQPQQIPSSAQIKQQQKANHREIEKTEEKIRRNDDEIATSLYQLSKINAGINSSQKRLKSLEGTINGLDNKINRYSSEIAQGEAQLKLMRDEYLKAIKKMRLRKGSLNSMSFVFSARNFYEAYRRLRYLKQFSEWKQKQSECILAKRREIAGKQKILADTRHQHNVALNDQRVAHKKLATQQQQQNRLVYDLKRNGEALHSHLAQKQAEANRLNTQISAAIAHEQEVQRQQEIALQKQKQLEDERRRAEADNKRKQIAAKKNVETAKQKENPVVRKHDKNSEQQSQKQKAPVAKKQDNKHQQSPEHKNNKKDYAQARKRKPRGQQDNIQRQEPPNPQQPPKQDKPKKQTPGSGFANSKGALPSPSTSGFRIVSRFGRHSHPNFPGVHYENPGVDAETSAGASARAVFPGKVTGVYILGGYHTVVIVNHGDYYTVYGNLTNACVKQGDQVKQGQQLGKLYTDPDTKSTQIHFEVWQGRTKLDPSGWLR